MSNLHNELDLEGLNKSEQIADQLTSERVTKHSSFDPRNRRVEIAVVNQKSDDMTRCIAWIVTKEGFEDRQYGPAQKKEAYAQYDFWCNDTQTH